MKEIKYNKSLIIRNTEHLPRGLGLPYLLCIEGQGGELVAKQWKRKKPKKMSSIETLVCFN